jgi:hypothetical protein
MNQEEAVQDQSAQQPVQEQPLEKGPVKGGEPPEASSAQTWTPPHGSRSWQQLPGINQLLFAASFGCFGIAGLRLVGPPLAETARQAYHPYTSEGKRETCLSNLQAIARAASLYAQDNSGRLPLLQAKSGKGNTTWITYLAPYVSDSKPWTCPVSSFPADGGSTYAFNPVLAGGSMASADDPAVTLLLADGSKPGALSLQPPYPGWNHQGSTSPNEPNDIAFGHEGIAGVVYADGHAGTLDPGGVKEAGLWGGSAAARASLRRIAERDSRSQTLVGALRRDDQAGVARLLRTKAPDMAAASRDLLALWELNAQFPSNQNSESETAATASQSVDTLGWNLAWAWHRIGHEAALKKLESHVRTQAATELERVKAAGPQSRPSPSGGTFDAPQGWADEETTQGNYRTLTLRSRVPGLFLYVEIGTRSTPAASPIPVDWRGAERQLKAKYGAGYRRIGMSRGTLSGHLAGVWDYELDKPGGPRLHKRLIGSVNDWNSTVFATTTPKESYGKWETTFKRVTQSF